MSASKSKSAFQARAYAKGDVVKVATSPSEAVALEFDGFAVQKDVEASDESANSGTTVSETAAVPDANADAANDVPDRKELQRLAKEAGVDARLSKDDLVAALDTPKDNA